MRLRPHGASTLGGNVTPTSEQARAVELFKTGEPLKINAFAGSGKTTTLKLLAEATTRRGLYLAFNKSIANDAKEKFPPNVTCSTIHSVAFRATPSAYRRGDKMTGRVNANALAAHLEIKDAILGGIRLSARSQGHLVLEALRKFMQSARPAPTAEDVPLIGKLEVIPDTAANEIRRITLDRACRVWARMTDPADALPLGHDGYLKMWALSRPNLATDFILLDEAQDTNPVVLDALRSQGAQIVYVGDRHQQIYEWRGAVNAMEIIETAHQSNLTTSFRFGDTIAAAASSVLRTLDEPEPIKGNPDKKSYIGADDCEAILARTNASVMSTVLNQLDRGRTPHVVGGVDEIVKMLRGVQDLKRGEPSDVPEFFGFPNWQEVVEHANSPEGESLRTFVSLVEQYGEAKLIARLNQTARDERDADLVVSTAHKAKGREWDTVELVDDFLRSRPKETPREGQPEVDPSEVRLFYVAMTRAKVAVEISPPVLERFGIVPGPRFVRPPKPVAAPRRDFSGESTTVPPKVSKPVASGVDLMRWWWLVAAAGIAFLMFS